MASALNQSVVWVQVLLCMDGSVVFSSRHQALQASECALWLCGEILNRAVYHDHQYLNTTHIHSNKYSPKYDTQLKITGLSETVEQ